MLFLSPGTLPQLRAGGQQPVRVEGRLCISSSGFYNLFVMDATPGLSQNPWLPPLPVIYRFLFSCPYILGSGSLVVEPTSEGQDPTKPKARRRHGVTPGARVVQAPQASPTDNSEPRGTDTCSQGRPCFGQQLLKRSRQAGSQVGLKGHRGSCRGQGLSKVLRAARWPQAVVTHCTLPPARVCTGAELLTPG